MEVNYEAENFRFNLSSETEYDFFPEGYSEDNNSQLVTEISNETDHLKADLPNLQKDLWALFDQRYLLHNLGWTTTLVMAYALIFFTGLVGNCMAILVVIKMPQMRSVTNLFILNLAVADLLLIIFCVPTELLVNIFEPWIFGSVMCKSVRYMEWTSACASAYSLTAISFDRCKAIYRPQVPPRGLSKRQALITIFMIWTISLILTIPIPMNLEKVIVNQIPYCRKMWESKLIEKIYFHGVAMFFFYCLPLILISISNIIIWWNVYKRNVPEDSASSSRIDKMHRKSRQSVGKMLGIVTVAFLLSWLPFYYFLTKVNFIGKLNPWEINVLRPLVLLIGFSNSSINPVLYALMSKKFRDAFKSLLPKWLPLIHRTENKCLSRETTASSVISVTT